MQTLCSVRSMNEETGWKPPARSPSGKYPRHWLRGVIPPTRSQLDISNSAEIGRASCRERAWRAVPATADTETTREGNATERWVSRCHDARSLSVAEP